MKDSTAKRGWDFSGFLIPNPSFSIATLTHTDIPVNIHQSFFDAQECFKDLLFIRKLSVNQPSEITRILNRGQTPFNFYRHQYC
jgi:hypothetical protein